MTIQGDYPPLGEFPTERFKSLEILELVDCGNDDPTLIRPHPRGPTPVVPFPALLEVRVAFSSPISLAGLAEILK